VSPGTEGEILTTVANPVRTWNAGATLATNITAVSPRWESRSSAWLDVPGATVPLSIGATSPGPVFGGLYVATFSAEALSISDDANNILWIRITFGGELADPKDPDENYRFASGASSGEWSSHTTIRCIQFQPQMAQRDITAKVQARQGDKAPNGRFGLQNYVLKVERYA
jgi:hypothetical protein